MCYFWACGNNTIRAVPKYKKIGQGPAAGRAPESLMTLKYRGSQQSSREVKPKFIDSRQGEPKNICKP
jgi:hypothetical protein